MPSIAADVVAEISAEPVFEHVKKEFLKRVPVVRLDLDAREELNRSLLQVLSFIIYYHKSINAYIFLSS
jgi:ribosome biogenesis SPOUT family RNA methylase Rps3